MDFRFTEEQEKFRQELRDFFKKEMPREEMQRHKDPREPDGYEVGFSKAFRKKIAQAGFLCLAIPKEYGGQGRTHLEHALFSYEHAYAAAPGGDLGFGILAPAILHSGNEEQKRWFIPKIAAAEITMCIGYSEPGAGSDLAALQTRAVADGDDYGVNGQKIFTSNGHFSDWIWLLARTDPNVPRHKGLSLFLVDMKSKGVTPRPLWTIAGWRHNEIFFDNVRVPKSAMVGELNRGWYEVMAALSFERSGFASYGTASRILDDLVEYCKEHKHNGQPLSKDPLVRQKLAQARMDVDTGMRFSMKVAWIQSRGLVPEWEPPMNKTWGARLVQRLSRQGMQMLGQYGYLTGGSKYAPMDGNLEFAYRDSVPATIAGGTDEVQLNIIAQRGFGLPR